jgi:hypothetical protein
MAPQKMPPQMSEKRPSALSSLLAKMGKFGASMRRSDASGNHSVSSGAVASRGNDSLRWADSGGNQGRGSNSNHNAYGGSGAQGSGGNQNDDEVVLADFDREMDSPQVNSSRPNQNDHLAALDWPGANSSSWPSSTPGMANTWPMGNTDSILPGTVNTQEDSPQRQVADRTFGKNSAAAMSSPLAAPNHRSNYPLSPPSQSTRPVPAPVPNLVAALPGSSRTSAPSREAKPTVCAPSGGARKNKRIVYSDPVVQWGFQGPAIRSSLRA